MAILADFGTSWTKVLDTDSGEMKVAPTKDMGAFHADLATGHNTRKRARPQRPTS